MSENGKLEAVASMPIDDRDWTFEGCQLRLRKATAIIVLAERRHAALAQRSADAEAVYRSQLGIKFGEYRANGEAVEAAKIAAHKDCAVLSRERDLAADLVKGALQQIENARESRSSLWALIGWARDRDLTSNRQQQPPQQGGQQQGGQPPQSAIFQGDY